MKKSVLKMKLTHQRMTGRYDNTPESVLDWLEEQLECRGIDALVYTRYILSLLQDYDETDEDQETNGTIGPIGPSIYSHRDTCDANGFCCQQTIIRRHKNSLSLGVKENIKPVTTNKWKHKRYLKQQTDIAQTFDCWPHFHCCPDICADSSESEKKLAVVQCLKSASENELGIESFVDELCAKLKNFKILSESMDLSPQTEHKTKSRADLTKREQLSPKEQAMKYYAAFPALDNNCNVNSTDKMIIKKIDGFKDGSNGYQTCDRVSSVDKTKWNGQKIIEFISGNNNTQQLATDSNQTKTDDNRENYQNCQNNEEFDVKDEGIEGIGINENNISGNFFYCQDIENNVLKSEDLINEFLVDNQNEDLNHNLMDNICEENNRFERLVNKFNRNIASIWSTQTETDFVLTKNDNIWSYDSSNQSSAVVTPSPKIKTHDLWSSVSNKQFDDNNDIQLNFWPISLLNSFAGFSDDGFIDGHFCETIDDHNNWSLNRSTIDQIITQSNKTSLQNHEKNSPFIEFNPVLSLNQKSEDNDNETDITNKRINFDSFFSGSVDRLSPVSQVSESENLLTSLKTHFQPIKQDSFQRDESDEGSVADNSDFELKKLVICSDKCPNNIENKREETSDYLKHRPISTSFGELSSIMGPFTDSDSDSEWHYSEQLDGSQSQHSILFNHTFDECLLSDKSTNTETNENIIDLNNKLSAIVETTETEPEYQDLYEMINEVLRKGVSDESILCDTQDRQEREDRPLTATIVNKLNDYETGFTNDMIGGKHFSYISKSVSDYKIDEKSIDSCESETNGKQIINDLLTNCTDYSYDELFFDEIHLKEPKLFDNCINSKSVPQLMDQIFKETKVSDESMVVPIVPPVGPKPGLAQNSIFESNCNLQFKSRNNENFIRLRKPCSFFIEGNCKRSDCKYSHEINRITCKYWEEGFCFKADLCPFLHGYNNDEIEFKSDLCPLELSDKSYAIESESDFPSLFVINEDINEDKNHISNDTNLTANILEQSLFSFDSKSLISSYNSSKHLTDSKVKLPIAVFMKRKVKKRKDRNLQ